MARGYPDFFGQQVVPKYGTCYAQQVLAATVVRSTDEDIFSLAHKGRIYGGYLELSGTYDETLTVIRTIIDGQVINTLVTADFRTRGLVLPSVASLFCVFWAPTIERYVFSLTPDMTFERTFVLNVDNGDAAADIGMVGRVLYTFIT